MFGKPVAKTEGAAFATVTSSNAELKTDMIAGKLYQFASSTNCFIKQGVGSQTAAAEAGNIFAPAGRILFISGSNGTHISVIRDTADGKCTLHEVQEV